MWDAQFYTVAAITMLAVISPGPDFAVILRNSISFGRKAGMVTALGIACGVCVHISYTLLGFSYLINDALWLLEVMRYAGAGYLMWLGASSFFPKARQEQSDVDLQRVPAIIAFRNGFICNAFNPKTALFFIALFTQVVDPQTPFEAQVGFGAYISLAHLAWFAFVAYFLTHDALFTVFDKMKVWIERIVGVCLIGLGVKLVLS